MINPYEPAVLLAEKLCRMTRRSRFEKWQRTFPFIGKIRGMGAMLGIELLKKDRAPAADEAKALIGYCHDNGLIILSCGTYGNVIRTLI
ncbi:MAG: aminotransferase class III-fold pyridoxal phosphate-dependent enzyme [Thermodesulfobacteriota bacterium]